MQLTLRADYALRLLMLLGSRASQPDAGRVSVADAARELNISWHHLRKIVNQLTHLGYLDSLRGRSGGLRLARPPTEIAIGEVVRAMEPNLEPARCTRAECPMYPNCHLRGVLDTAMDAFLSTLDRYSLAEMLDSRADADLSTGPAVACQGSDAGPAACG